MARDWPADLWPTSFKGVPFWVRKAEPEFGKRLQEDEFPEQDAPFVQELGAAIGRDQIDAYLIGDTSDADATAFRATLLSLGTGTYVDPIEGPIEVMFKIGRRAYELDRQGFIGFSLTFVRVGTFDDDGSSTDFLGNLVSVAADGIDDAASALMGQLGLS